MYKRLVFDFVTKREKFDEIVILSVFFISCVLSFLNYKRSFEEGMVSCKCSLQIRLQKSILPQVQHPPPMQNINWLPDLCHMIYLTEIFCQKLYFGTKTCQHPKQIWILICVHRTGHYGIMNANVWIYYDLIGDLYFICVFWNIL